MFTEITISDNNRLPFYSNALVRRPSVQLFKCYQEKNVRIQTLPFLSIKIYNSDGNLRIKIETPYTKRQTTRHIERKSDNQIQRTLLIIAYQKEITLGREDNKGNKALRARRT